MARLTDTQLVILAAAANRGDRAVLPLPKSLKINGAAVTNTLDGLRKKGLLEEKPAPREAVVSRNGEDGRRMTLVITDAGLQAITGGPASESSRPDTSVKLRTKKSRSLAGPKAAASKSKAEGSPTTVRPGTKQALLIDLLKRKDGASIDEAVEALGWQAHSIRGAISGALKKKLGLAVSAEKVDGRGRVYRIAGQD